jgi:rhodanese-related sulfurtransferase
MSIWAIDLIIVLVDYKGYSHISLTTHTNQRFVLYSRLMIGLRKSVVNREFEHDIKTVNLTCFTLSKYDKRRIYMKLAPKLLIIAVAVMAVPALMNAECPGKCSGACVMEKGDAFVKSVPENMMFLMPSEKIAEMIDAGKMHFMVLDIRPPKSYSEGYIEGSMNIPLTTLVEKMNSIPKDKRIAVVCTIDTNSAFAVAVLRMNGYNAWVVEGGIPGWQNSGFPLVK